MGITRTRYYIRLDVDDRPGVLAQVATAFAANDVSIQQVRQQGHPIEPDDEPSPASGDPGAQLVIVTHAAPDSSLSATVDALAAMDTVRGVTSVMRVEGD